MKIISKSYNNGISGLKKKLLNLNGKIAVGIFSDSGTYNNGAKVLDVALVHEFGSVKKNIPKRSFLKSTANTKKQEIKKHLISLSKDALNGKDVKNSRKKVGAWFSAEVSKTIRKGGIPFKSNSQNTVKQKGDNTPLRDTGLLMKSIRWQEL